MTKLTIRLTFDGPVNIGSGALGGSLADKPLTRDARGLPMIPASAFKGKLRHEVERLVPVLYPDAKPPCVSPVAEMMCQGDSEPCLVCQLFGSPWHAGKLVFKDLYLVEPDFLTRDEPPAGTMRYGVGLSRHRKVAEDQLLYTTEVFLPGTPVTFEGSITGDLSPEQLELLKAGLDSLLTVGGGNTQGMGWLDADVVISDDENSPVLDQQVLDDDGRSLEVVVRLQSPLLLGGDSNEAYYKTTRTHIPGRALRGALAQCILNAKSASEYTPANGQDDFDVLFNTEPAVVFDNLYPTTSGSREFSFPVPNTARSCKYHSGFRDTKDKSEKEHGVGDILIRQCIFEYMLANPDVRLPVLYKPSCPECGADVDIIDGFIMMVAPDKFEKVEVPVRRTSRTAINRQRGVAQDGQLYTLEFIEPADDKNRATTFRGRVTVDQVQKAVLVKYLPQVKSLGGSKTRGLGHITVSFLSPGRARRTGLPKLEERLADFDKKIREEWSFYERISGVTSLPEDVHFFSVDLLSSAILTWHSIPVNTPTPAMLGFSERVSLVRAFADYGIAGGWHMGAKLPRRIQRTVEMGSVFMYRSEGYSIAELAKRLGLIEAEGIGLERAQGFGRVSICLPFHYNPEVEL